jgi:hypothetical protein
LPPVHAELVLQGTLFLINQASVVIAYLGLSLDYVLECAHWRFPLLRVLLLGLYDDGDAE